MTDGGTLSVAAGLSARGWGLEYKPLLLWPVRRPRFHDLVWRDRCHAIGRPGIRCRGRRRGHTERLDQTVALSEHAILRVLLRHAGGLGPDLHIVACVLRIE